MDKYNINKILFFTFFFFFRIPDSPAEPDPETHPYQDPNPIPLDDVSGNPDSQSVNDFQNQPWPEPKGMMPPSPQIKVSNTNNYSFFYYTYILKFVYVLCE